MREQLRKLMLWRNNPTTRAWISIVSLVLAVALLLWALALTLLAAGNPSAVGCHNAPLRVTRDPQWAGILVSVSAFVLGRLTARPRVIARAHLMWFGNKRPNDATRARDGLLMHAALTLALVFMAYLITLEAVTLVKGFWPITYYLRCANEAATGQTLFAAFAFCFLAGRWLWLPTTPADDE